MGYVTVTESVGEVIKTYHFSSYDDFKDWENKISGVVVSADEVTLQGDIWIKNKGEYPPEGMEEESPVEVKFKNGSTSKGEVWDFFGWSIQRLQEYSGHEEWMITDYRKLI